MVFNVNSFWFDFFDSSEKVSVLLSNLKKNLQGSGYQKWREDFYDKVEKDAKVTASSKAYNATSVFAKGKTLKLFKATSSLFYFEDIRIYRDHRKAERRQEHAAQRLASPEDRHHVAQAQYDQK